MKRVFALLIALALMLTLSPALATDSETSSPSKYTQYLADSANLLSDETKAAILCQSKTWDRRYNSLVAVVSTASIGDGDIEDFAFDKGAELGLSENDAILLLVADSWEYYVAPGTEFQTLLSEDAIAVLQQSLSSYTDAGDPDAGVIDFFSALDKLYRARFGLGSDTFSDVPAGAWYAPYVEVCVDTGLMNGVGGGMFAPERTLTVGECAVLAARLLYLQDGSAGPLPAAPSDWGQSYAVPEPTAAWVIDAAWFLKEHAGADASWILWNSSNPCIRQDAVSLLSPAVAGLPPLISLSSLPDTEDEQVFAFYEAGILSGTDNMGTFDGDKALTRTEAAAVLVRILKPSMRQISVQGGNGEISTQEAQVLLENRAVVLTAFWEENLAELNRLAAGREDVFVASSLCDMYGPLIVDASLVYSSNGSGMEGQRDLGGGWWLSLIYRYMPN